MDQIGDTAAVLAFDEAGWEWTPTALLVVIAANEHAGQPAPIGMTPLLCNEIRRPFAVLIVTPRRATACPHV